MKLKLILLPAVSIMTLWLNSCGPSGEYHTVTVYERTHHVASRPAPPKDDPRAFIPKERF